MEMQHFIDCLEGRSTVRTDGEEATNVLSVLQAAQMSIEADNRWINIADLYN